MNDRCVSCYESRQNPAYQSTLAHVLLISVGFFVAARCQSVQSCSVSETGSIMRRFEHHAARADTPPCYGISRPDHMRGLLE